MTRVSRRSDLLERLAAGPLPSSEWREWAASPGSLRVRICQLRDAGYPIESIASRAKPGQRVAPVSYRLHTCPTCNRELAA